MNLQTKKIAPVASCGELWKCKNAAVASCGELLHLWRALRAMLGTALRRLSLARQAQPESSTRADTTGSQKKIY